MEIDLLLSLIGVVVAIISAIIAYFQLKYQIFDVKSRALVVAETTGAIVSLSGEFLLFAPIARIEGLKAGFINRKAELNRLRLSLLKHKSLVVVEGMIGIGKTTLVGKFCRSWLLHWMGYKIGWVFCAERRVTIKSLARSIALDLGLPRENELYRLLLADVSSELLSDYLIRYLYTNRFILVLDDYHLVSSEEVHNFIRKVARSRLRGMVILTSEEHIDFLEKFPTVEVIRLEGLPVEDAVKFLREYGVDAEEQILRKIWGKAGNGVPQAMRILVGLSRTYPVFELLQDKFPVYTKNLEAWVHELIATLSVNEIEVLKFIAFCYESVPLDLLRKAFPSEGLLLQALDGLFDKFLISRSDSHISLHPLVRDYVFRMLLAEDRERFSGVVTDYFAEKTRDMLLGVKEEPSYGKVYLEAYPEYVQDQTRHMQFIDALIDRLRENGFVLPTGSKILVLGAGHGTHDAAFAKHGFHVVNVELLEEAADIGRERAKELEVPITYLVADMTEELDIEPDSMDAVFNIGSSFGFEKEDAKNAMVFRNAAKALKKGQPFVFEYANGIYWSKSPERDVEVKELPNGSIRIKYKIYNSVQNTCLDIIILQRPDGSKAYFYHFMHYYSLSQVVDMMVQAGLEIVAVYGSPDGDPFNPDESPSMVIIALKK